MRGRGEQEYRRRGDAPPQERMEQGKLLYCYQEL